MTQNAKPHRDSTTGGVLAARTRRGYSSLLPERDAYLHTSAAAVGPIPAFGTLAQHKRSSRDPASPSPKIFAGVANRQLENPASFLSGQKTEIRV